MCSQSERQMKNTTCVLRVQELNGVYDALSCRLLRWHIHILDKWVASGMQQHFGSYLDDTLLPFTRTQ